MEPPKQVSSDDSDSEQRTVRPQSPQPGPSSSHAHPVPRIEVHSPQPGPSSRDDNVEDEVAQLTQQEQSSRLTVPLRAIRPLESMGSMPDVPGEPNPHAPTPEPLSAAMRARLKECPTPGSLASNEYSPAREGEPENPGSPPGNYREPLPDPNPPPPVRFIPRNGPVLRMAMQPRPAEEPAARGDAQVVEDVPLPIDEAAAAAADLEAAPPAGNHPDVEVPTDHDSGHPSSRTMDTTDEDVAAARVPARRAVRRNAQDGRHFVPFDDDGLPVDQGFMHDTEEDEALEGQDDDENEAARIQHIDPPQVQPVQHFVQRVQQPQAQQPLVQQHVEPPQAQQFHQLQHQAQQPQAQAPQAQQFHHHHFQQPESQGSDSSDSEVANLLRNCMECPGGSRANIRPEAMEMSPPCFSQAASTSGLTEAVLRRNLKRSQDEAGCSKDPHEPPPKQCSMASPSDSGESIMVVSEESLPPQTPGEAPPNSSPALPGAGGDVQEGVEEEPPRRQEEAEDMRVLPAGEDRGPAIYEIQQEQIERGQIAEDEARQVGENVVAGRQVMLRQRRNAPEEGQGERVRLADNPRENDDVPEGARVFPEIPEQQDGDEDSDEEEANHELERHLRRRNDQGRRDGREQGEQAQAVQHVAAGAAQGIVENGEVGVEGEEQAQFEQRRVQNERMQPEEQQEPRDEVQDEAQQDQDATDQDEVKQKQARSKARYLAKKIRQGDSHDIDLTRQIERLLNGEEPDPDEFGNENDVQDVADEEEETVEEEEEEEEEENERIVDDHPRRNFDDDDFTSTGGQSVMLISAPNCSPAENSCETSPIKPMPSCEHTTLISRLEVEAKKQSPDCSDENGNPIEQINSEDKKDKKITEGKRKKLETRAQRYSPDSTTSILDEKPVKNINIDDEKDSKLDEEKGVEEDVTELVGSLETEEQIPDSSSVPCDEQTCIVTEDMRRKKAGKGRK